MAASDPAEFWEERYRSSRDESGQVWSGRVNAAVEHEVAALTPGTALELGCGEGGDALWLAAHGWSVTAIDISTTALAVGAAEAERKGLADRIAWVHADLSTWRPTSSFDLVASAFLHSPVELPREEVLRRAASAVAPGGRLLVVGHGAPPPGAKLSHEQHGGPPLPTPDEVLASLELADGWTTETSALVDRSAVWRDGSDITLVDAVLRIRRSDVSA
ncbi:SAM-dependent methyltransferase [Microbacterium sp. SA39]|uniref:SAM-dependent methyltransferase n=1 Tax=Microbacterium sp. SA39 TaxID=1263625 RepID=UPI0005F9DDC1|nr:class I SAM-dependent methyltransferase [Microbacterium sp. SA39]KJQ55559.1 Release factor glutamine methyltransferase [Microbacterium sp. SA39]